MRQYKVLTFVLMAIGLVFFQNCSKVSFKKTSSESDPGISGQCVGANCPQKQCFNQSFTQPTGQPKLDLLLIIDTSASLSSQRAALAANISQFLGALPSNIDFQVATLLAHGYDSLSGVLYRRNTSEDFVLSNQDLTISEIQNILGLRITNPPSEGNYPGSNTLLSSGGETGIYALHKLITENFSETQNLGFFRPDAGAAFLFLSDENDLCYPYADRLGNIPSYEAEFHNMFCSNPTVNADTVLSEISFALSNRPFFMSGIVYSDPDHILQDSTQDGYGAGYVDIINSSQKRSLIDLAGGNIPGGLAEIGSAASSILNLIFSYDIMEDIVVDGNSIKVSVDGVLQSSSSYSLNGKTINMTSVGQPNSVVELRYCEQ